MIISLNRWITACQGQKTSLKFLGQGKPKEVPINEELWVEEMICCHDLEGKRLWLCMPVIKTKLITKGSRQC